MGKNIHGHSQDGKTTAEYRAYYAMRNRCLNPNQARYKDYGGRGIGICDRWLTGEAGLTGFQCFFADMGLKPSAKHTLDRRDNDRGYGPDNCRWATPVEQARNMRTARLVDVCGVEVSLVEAVERWGAVSYDTASMRLHRGWCAEDALFVPRGGRPGDADLDLGCLDAQADAGTVVLS